MGMRHSEMEYLVRGADLPLVPDAAAAPFQGCKALTAWFRADARPVIHSHQASR